MRIRVARGEGVPGVRVVEVSCVEGASRVMRTQTRVSFGSYLTGGF